MLDPHFVFLGAIVDFAGVAAYALGTLRGRTQPNRVSWALWALVPLITLFAQLSQGVGLTAVLTLTIALGPLLVVAASFMNKQSYWRISRFDWACGALSLLAILIWAITKDGLTAIILSLVADFIAGLPTLIKAYRQPETENGNAYLAGIASAGITLLTVKTWTFAIYGFPVYILIFCVILVVLIKFPNLRPRQVAA